MVPARDPLRTLSGRAGLAVSYRDALGELRRPPAESLLAVLRARGIPIERPEEAPRHLAELERRHWQRPFDDCVVSWGRAAPVARLRLPARLASRAVEVTIEREDGERLTRVSRAAERAERARARVGSASYVEHELRLARGAPPGLHRVIVASGLGEHELTWIAAPARAHALARPALGVFAPLHALRSRASLGVGDFDDLGALVDGVARLGGDVVAMLPILAAFLDEPFDPSPYAPVSRLHLNELHLGLASVPEAEGLGAAALRLGTAASSREAQAAIAAPTVDHRRVMRLKRGMLEACARQLYTRGGPRRDALEAFLHAHPGVLDYARFRAAAERLGPAWPRWPAPGRAGALAQTGLEDERVRHHAYAQWLVREQLGAVAQRARSAGPGLMLDYPVGVHPEGYDTWRHRSCFMNGCSLGAPPDDFFRKGQGWGLAALDPGAVASRDGLEYVRAAFATSMAFAGALRIDHVMGLTRTFVIPSGATPADGVYVAMPREALHALVVLESNRHRCAVLGEDLGTVPPGVRETMRRRGLLRMHVLELELAVDRADPLPREVPADAVASFGSHDMATFAGFLRGRDVDERERMALLAPPEVDAARRQRVALVKRLAARLRARPASDPAALLERVWRWLAASPARLALVALEDLWLETEPHNVPGSGAERGNWTRRDAHSIEEILENPSWTGLLARVARARPES